MAHYVRKLSFDWEFKGNPGIKLEKNHYRTQYMYIGEHN